MNAKELYLKLRPLQEKIGYYFNRDEQRTMDLLEGLLINKERYGYMSCPCRLASGDRQHDVDIICPCAYREKDVLEYGSCYCNLYVSSEWNTGQMPDVIIPERRPPEKMFY
jgi:ferredoxin-thioredoxin reductase catalytic subunit